MILKQHLIKFLTLALIGSCAACGSVTQDSGGFQLPVPESATGASPRTFDPKSAQSLEQLVGMLADKRAIFIGEIHDRAAHHQNQLRVIQALYARDPGLAIGMEYFQGPFQQHLDDYIAGRIDEKEMLKKTDYYTRWGMDYRLLRPIMQFAQENHIPLVALNISEEIHHKVFTAGMASLTPEERVLAPADIQDADEDYRLRLKAIFDSHPQGNSFDNFVAGQLLWDEAMAEAAAQYLQVNPGSRLVVLAGSGHVMYGAGIPGRLDRRMGGKQSAVAINGSEFGEHPGIADYILLAEDDPDLPKTGKLGVMIDNGNDGVRVEQFVDNSAAKSVGIESGDLIVALDGRKVASIADLKALMFDRQPGELVSVAVRRSHLLAGDEELQFEVQLR